MDCRCSVATNTSFIHCRATDIDETGLHLDFLHGSLLHSPLFLCLCIQQLSLSLSVCLCLSLCLCFCLSLFLSLSVCLSVSLRVTTELFQKNGYDLNACTDNVIDIMYNTDVMNHIVKWLVHSPVGKLV